MFIAKFTFLLGILLSLQLVASLVQNKIVEENKFVEFDRSKEQDDLIKQATDLIVKELEAVEKNTKNADETTTATRHLEKRTIGSPSNYMKTSLKTQPGAKRIFKMNHGSPGILGGALNPPHAAASKAKKLSSKSGNSNGLRTGSGVMKEMHKRGKRDLNSMMMMNDQSGGFTQQQQQPFQQPTFVDPNSQQLQQQQFSNGFSQPFSSLSKISITSQSPVTVTTFGNDQQQSQTFQSFPSTSSFQSTSNGMMMMPQQQMPSTFDQSQQFSMRQQPQQQLQQSPETTGRFLKDFQQAIIQQAANGFTSTTQLLGSVVSRMKPLSGKRSIQQLQQQQQQQTGYSNNLPTIANDIVPTRTPMTVEPQLLLKNSCENGYVQPIWENDEITETYCRCPDNSYGLTCRENFQNPCTVPDAQFFPSAPVFQHKYFIHCENFTAYLKKCPGVLFWNDAVKACDYHPTYYQSYAYPPAPPTPIVSSVQQQLPAYGNNINTVITQSTFSPFTPQQSSYSSAPQQIQQQAPLNSYSSSIIPQMDQLQPSYSAVQQQPQFDQYQSTAAFQMQSPFSQLVAQPQQQQQNSFGNPMMSPFQQQTGF